MRITTLIDKVLFEDKEEKKESKVVEKVEGILQTESGKKTKRAEKKKEGMFANKPDKKENGLRIFYNIKANITDTSGIMSLEPDGSASATTQEPASAQTPVGAPPMEGQMPTAPVAPVAPAAAPIESNPLFQSTKISGEMLNEETYSFGKSGDILIKKENASMISSFEALADYLTKDDASDKGPVLDEVMSNILMIASGVDGSKQLTSVIKKEDYIYCSVDCGNSVEDSIGILLRKVSGVNLVSLNLKKDGNILAAFSLQDFNSELIRYINDLK